MLAAHFLVFFRQKRKGNEQTIEVIAYKWVDIDKHEKILLIHK